MTISTAYISLGGNQGDVVNTLEESVRRLSAIDEINVASVSSFYRTAAVGSSAGDPFINAVARLTTTLEPEPLLDQLQRIENELGRTRTIRWGPRTLDLDLLFYDLETLSTPRLTIPHPAAWYRRFVLVPLVEINPHVRHPVKSVDVSRLLGMTEAEPYVIHFIGDEVAYEIVRTATGSYPQIDLRHINSGSNDDGDPDSDSKADLARPHSLTLFRGSPVKGSPAKGSQESISWQDCPDLTSIDLSEIDEVKLPETIEGILASALGNVTRIEKS